MDKKNRMATLVCGSVVLGVIGLTVCVGLWLPKSEEIIQGEVEVTDYRLSSKVPARVLEIRVEEGDRVRQGDTLVVLDAPDVDARLRQAEAAYHAAVAQERKAQNGTREEQVRSAYEQWQKARTGLDVAEKTWQRISRLAEQGVVAAQKRDEALAQRDAAAATEAAARAQYEMARNGARQEDRSAATAQVERAESAVSEVRSYVGETVLLASADGVVTEIFPEEGELVGTGAPLMNVACTDQFWFTFHVREDLLPGLQVGTEAQVYLPTLDRSVPVRITRMNHVGNFAAWKATKAMDGLDLKTFEVRAKPVRPLAHGEVYAGMSAVLKTGKVKN